MQHESMDHREGKIDGSICVLSCMEIGKDGEKLLLPSQEAAQSDNR